MYKTSPFFAEADSLTLASITEIESGKFLNSQDFKSLIKEKILILTNEYHIKPGQSVLLLQNNSIEFFIHFLALFCIGASIIPMDKNLKESELDNVIKFARPALIISDQGFKTVSNSTSEELNGIALVLFTSGTTAVPKGVLISKKALLRKMEIMSNFIPVSHLERSLCFIPTFFGHGLICNSLFPLFKGQHFYLKEKMDMQLASEFNKIIDKHDISFFSSVPSHWEMILQFSAKYEGTSLRRVHTASSPLRPDSISRILEWLNGVPFFDLYGATEMLGWFASQRVVTTENAGKFDTFWKAEKLKLPNGELGVKSDYMFSGYWGNREKEEYFNTGDLFINEKLVGRTKNVINKNGIKISTDELNLLLLKSNLLKNVGTFPLEDKYTGERIGALVALKSGISLDEFKNYCRKNLSAHYMPSEIIPVEQIPVNARGKSTLYDLKAFYEGLHK